MNTEQAIVPEFMRAMVGDQNFRDLEGICARLTDLEERGAISSEWHQQMLEEIAGELVIQRMATDLAEQALTAEAPCPDAPDSCGH